MIKLRRTAAALAAAFIAFATITLASPAQAGDTSWDIAGPSSVDDTSWD